MTTSDLPTKSVLKAVKYLRFFSLREKVRGQAKFNPEVKRAVFSKRRMTNRCLEHVPATSSVDEDDMASRRSEFHLVNLTGKRALHEHHLFRKKCRLRKRQDIIDASWIVDEQETWNRLNEIVGSPDVTVEDVEAFALEAILSVNKNEIVKLWREKLMVTVEQHEMVPFHDRWVQNQFRDQDKLETKVKMSNYSLLRTTSKDCGVVSLQSGCRKRHLN